MRRRRAGWAVAAVLPLLAAMTPAAAGASAAGVAPVSGLAPLSALDAASLAKDVATPVVVVLKDQHLDLPDNAPLARRRASVLAGDQTPILADLRLTGARTVKTFTLLNAVAATVSAGEAARLASDPAVARVVPDVSWDLGHAPAPPATPAAVPGPGLWAPSGQQICPAAGHVQLNPEALKVIHANSDDPGVATAHGLGFDGSGVTVAYIAEGIDIHNPDLTRDGRSVFTDYQDFTGDGTAAPTSGGEAFLDASSIAAQGQQVYDLHRAGYPVPAGCRIRILGVAPGANLVGLKVFPSSNQATTSSLVQAVDYAVNVDHVDVLNESFGYNPLPDTARDLVRQADEAAVDAGTTVVSSSGDAGSNGTQGSPSTASSVISAGATTTFRSYAQTGVGGYQAVKAAGWLDDNISALSSGGTIESGRGPDLVAPGDLNWVLCTPKPRQYSSCAPGVGVALSGGTSESAPLTAATAALVIQAYRSTHVGASPTPALIKRILMSTASDLGHPSYEQGAGLLDSFRAVQAARSVSSADGSPSPAGESVLRSVGALRATAATGTTVRFPVTVTNSGASTQTLTMHGRLLGAPTTVLDTTVRAPALVQFTVPAGVSRLDASIAKPAGSITLLTPEKYLAAYSLPQGNVTGFGHVDVRYPDGGTWTAFVAGKGPTKVVASVSSYESFGTVTPSSVTLPPGQSATVVVAASTPSSPGDLSAAIHVDLSSGAPISIPLDLRSLIPLSGGEGAFAATVTGGNGRGGAPAETRYFQVDVPSGQTDLNVATTLPAATGDAYATFLVAPDGVALAEASNQLPGAPAGAFAPGAAMHVLSPVAGRWTIIVAVSNPVGGTSLSAPLAGTIDMAATPVETKGVPDGPGVHLKAGVPTTVALTVRNVGPVPEALFVDGRSRTVQTLALAPYTNATGVVLPLPAKPPTPQWIVPTDTSALAAVASATAPVSFDWAPYLGTIGGAVGGDPNLGATSIGTTAAGTFAAPVVTPGDWYIDPALIGPFGSSPAPSATADLAMTATTRGFDTAVSSSTGDVWLRSVDATAAAATPMVVAPGASATITVTINPSAPVGTVVRGDLFVGDTTVISPFGTPVGPTGDQLAAVPYSYTVG